MAASGRKTLEIRRESDKMIDLHVHTHHSCDSNVSIEEYCQKALDKGVNYICFTDHVDFNKADDGYGFYDSEKFFSEFEKEKDKYSDRINLLCGIEFAEPHVHKREFDEFRKLPYDFILGSIHYWFNDMFPSEMLKKNIPVEATYDRYWEEVYKAVSYGGFDSLAHIDFPKRYCKKCIWNRSQIKDIFKQMISNDIALEINTSSLRKGLTETMPDKEFLLIYEDAGGKKVTVGADTHAVEDLASGYEYANSLISGVMESTVFINRKPVQYKSKDFS